MELAYFVLLVFLVLFLPGRFILRSLSYPLESLLRTVGLSVVVGICSFLFFTYVLSYLHLEFFYNVFILIVDLACLIKYPLRKPKFNHSDFLNLFLVVIGSLSMLYITARSGIVSSVNMNLFSSNAIDSIYHLSLVGNLTHTFPPTYASVSNIPLRGYHFFYDFLVAHFVRFYRLDIYNSLFRYFPLLISFFYGITGWIAAKESGLKNNAVSFFLLLLYFASGLSFIFNFLGFSGSFNPGVNPLLVNIIDPSVLLSLIVTFSLFVFLFSKKRSLLICSLLLGVLPLIKIYIAVLVYIAVFLLFLVKLIKQKDSFYLKLLLVGGVISSIVYIPTNLGAGGLIFSPFLYFRHFMETSTIFSPLKWPLKMQVYETYHNYPRIIILYLVSIFLFFITTLGVRILSVIKILDLRNYDWKDEKKLFWTGIVIFGILFPVFFIQSTAVFNIIQFMWISYVIILIPTSEVLGDYFAKIGRLGKIILVILLLFLIIPDDLTLVKAYSTNPTIVSAELVQASNIVRESTPALSNLLSLIPSSGGAPLISALTSRSVYYESPGLEFNSLERVVDIRSAELKNINNEIAECKSSEQVNKMLSSFMVQNNLSYVFSLEDKCLDQSKSFRKVKLTSNYFLYEFTR